MGTAETIEMEERHDTERRDTITETYETMLDDIGTLEIAAEFWKRTWEHPEMAWLIAKLDDELTETARGWMDIKPGEFRDSQARARALRAIISEIEQRVPDSDAELKAKKQLKAHYEIQNELILRGAGYDFDVKAAREQAAEQTVAEQAEAGPAICQDCNVHIVLSKRPPASLVKALKKAGFAEHPDDSLLWIAPDSEEMREKAETLHKSKDGDFIDYYVGVPRESAEG